MSLSKTIASQFGGRGAITGGLALGLACCALLAAHPETWHPFSLFMAGLGALAGGILLGSEPLRERVAESVGRVARVGTLVLLPVTAVAAVAFMTLEMTQSEVPSYVSLPPQAPLWESQRVDPRTAIETEGELVRVGEDVDEGETEGTCELPRHITPPISDRCLSKLLEVGALRMDGERLVRERELEALLREVRRYPDCEPVEVDYMRRAIQRECDW